jgi:hypothetical protein
MKRIEARLAKAEARAPRQDDHTAEQEAAAKWMCDWAVVEEINALLAAADRYRRGRPNAGDDELVVKLQERWEARCDDPAIESHRILGATSWNFREPERVNVGSYWQNWLSAFNARDAAGAATPEDWATWWRLMNAIEKYVIRREPLPPGVSWETSEAMPLDKLDDTP